MPWEPDFIEDGSVGSAASVNDPLEAAQVWINDLEREGIANGAFNYLQAYQVLTETKSTGFTKTGDDGLHTYNFGTFGASITYGGYGLDGGSSVAGVYTGDRTVVGHPDQSGPYGQGKAEITFDGSGLKVGMENGERCAGILVLFNCVVQVYTVADYAVSDPVIMFCIQYKLSGDATWRTIDESEAHASLHDHRIIDSTATELIGLDIPIATLITEATVDEHGDPATQRVTGVRAMFSLGGAIAGHSVSMGRFRLSALPLHASRPDA